MGFEYVILKDEKDKEYVEGKGFVSLFGTKNYVPYAAVIDRERDIVLVETGNDNSDCYAIYIDGEVIDLDCYKQCESAYEKSGVRNTLKEHWTVTKIYAHETFFQKNLDEEYVTQCIKEACIAFSFGSVDPGRMRSATVDIRAGFENEVREISCKGFKYIDLYDDKDKKYVEEKGFRDFTGRLLLDPLGAVIDKERDIVFMSTGGGGPWGPECHAIYIDGEIIDMEGFEVDEGSHFDNTLIGHWKITRIMVNKSFYEKKMDEEYVKQCIKEACIEKVVGLYKPGQVRDVTVDIQAKFEIKK